MNLFRSRGMRACRRAAPILAGLWLGLVWGSEARSQPEKAEPSDLPYAQAVADRFSPPAQTYDTPGLAPGRTRWTDNDELAAALQAVSATGRARWLAVGRSESGAPIMALHFTRADRAQPGGARPVALLLGQQHGNEPAGAEALLVVARRLADPTSALAVVLDRLDVIVLPRANPDGSQLGRRSNAAGLDINRDHLRLRTPEAVALAELVQRWRPVLVVDVHEHSVLNRRMPRFGGIKRHDLLWQAATTPNLPPALSAAAESWFGVPLRRDLAAADLTVEWYYTNPGDDTGLRLDMGGVQPDLARNAQGLKNAVSLLLESRGFDLGRLHAQRRVHTHVVALQSLLASAAEHGDALQALQARLSAEVTAQACRGDVVLSAAPARMWRPLLMLDPDTGADKTVMVDWGSALDLVPQTTRARPCGYWLSAEASDAVRTLHRLGVRVHTLSADQRLQVQRYRETDLIERAPLRGADPSLSLRRITVALEPGSFDPPEGSFYVPLDQPLAHLVVAALEPDAPSSWFAHQIVPQLSWVQRVMAVP